MCLMKFNSSWRPFLCGLISHSQISVPPSALVRCLLSTQSSVARVHTATSLSMNVTRLSLLNARKKNILPQVSSSITRLHFKASLLFFFFFYSSRAFLDLPANCLTGFTSLLYSASFFSNTSIFLNAEE